MKRRIGLVAALWLALAPAALAQVARGNIYGTVTDESGARLPGVQVTLSGELGTVSTITDGEGRFRFLNVDHGDHTITIALEGFATVSRNVRVTTGENVQLGFSMKVAAVEETLLVTAETPIVDRKQMGTATTLTREELTQVPNSRDPWAILRTVPGVVVDRVNIAGAESGQQSQYLGKGSAQDDATWSLDGVVITDMAALGASPTYFDYDQFDEMAVTTGGNGVEMATGGVQLSVVTKRGTNRFHGTVRGFLTHDDLQSSNLPDELVGDPRLGDRDKADHIAQISDYGFDLGGPIIQDKLWFYGGWGKRDIRIVRLSGTADKTNLQGFTGKLNWQATQNDMISVFWYNGPKIKNGRSPGTGLEEEDSFLWNQDSAYSSDFHGLFKGEINHIFSPSFFANVKYAYYGNGFTLAPRGSFEENGTLDYVEGTAIGTYLDFTGTRPQNTLTVDASYFVENHELKFGFGHRKQVTSTSLAWAGNGILGLRLDTGGGLGLVFRPALSAYDAQYIHAFASDTFTKDRLTLSAGLRFDHQYGENLPSQVPANPAFPDLLPAVDYTGGGAGVSWTDFSPRVGFTYALDDSRRTILRASFARYAGQLGPDASFDNPVGVSLYIAEWDDRDGDRFVSADEATPFAPSNVDPNDPAGVESPNTIADDYSANHDVEAIVGLEREVADNFSLSAAWTWRRGTDWRGDGDDWAPRIGFTPDDFFVSDTASGNGYTATAFAPDPDRVAQQPGRILMNRADYHTVYNGAELVATKRMSDDWMMRVAFAYADWKEYLDGPGAIDNPTRTVRSGSNPDSGPQEDGGQIAPQAGGSGKGNIFANARWTVNANVLYEAPAGIELAASLYGRQGYLVPIEFALDGGGDQTLNVLVDGNSVDTERYDDLWNLDFRAAKSVRMGDASLVFSAEVFNVFNASTELSRFRDAGSAAFLRLDEILSPRIVRLGVRLAF